MTLSPNRPLVEQIHTAGYQCALAITGGGSRAISELLTLPGASASILEVVVPYSGQALTDYLGGLPDQSCSESTARAMAMAAFQRACQLSTADAKALRGIGVTASLATNRPKRGPHRIHIAWQSAMQTVVHSCQLDKGPRDRGEEEQLATELVLATVAEACGLDIQLQPPSAAEPITTRRQTAQETWAQLLLGEREAVFVPDSKAPHSKETPRVLFPGAFNPLHQGHLGMAAVAESKLGGPVCFELSIANVDKPLLDFIEIEERLSQLSGQAVMLTRAATFATKAALAPDCTFVVGADTISRIGQSRYYDHTIAQREASIAAIRDLGCRFLVFGRRESDKFITLADLDLPSFLRELCDEVAETEFREDVTSTRLRTS